MAKKRMNKKLISSGMFVLCMILAVLFTALYARANEEKTIQYLRRTYTSDNTAPDTPSGYLFAGWYNDDDADTEDAVASPLLNQEYYAKFVPAEVLDIKAQVSDTLYDSSTENDSVAAIRFITTVDSLEYKHVGFNIQKGEKVPEDAATSKYVYKELYAVDAKDETGSKSKYTPKVFHDESEFFKTWTISNIKDSTYNTEVTVVPYWITLDGTRVEGERTVKTVNMGRSWVYVDSTDSATEELGTYDNPYKTLADAMNHETPLDPTVILKSDVTLDEKISVTKNMTLTNERNVTVTDAAESGGTLITVKDNARLTVEAINNSVITFDGNDTSEAAGNQLASVSANGVLNLKNVCVKNIYNSKWGTAINNAGTLNLLEGCVFENNSGAAGTIYNTGTLTDNGTTYCNNTAHSNDGGAVLNDGSATFTGCTFNDNVTATRGGAVANRQYNSPAQVSFTNCIFTANKAEKSHGGAVWSEGKKHEMTNCTFDGNVAKNGGALYISMGSAGFTGSDCIFTNNRTTSDSAYGAGAAMFTGGNTATLTNSTENNGVYDYTKAKFVGNTNNGGTGIYGGAVVVWADTTLDITGYQFENNTARAGAAVYVHDNGSSVGTLNDKGGYYKGNVGTVNAGGAIRNAGNATFVGTKFEANKIADDVKNDGGAIYTAGDTLTCKNVTFDNNTADRGGALYINPKTESTLTDCTFIGDDNTVFLTNNDELGQTEVVLSGKTTGMTAVYTKNDVGLVVGEQFDTDSSITIMPNEYQLDVQVVGVAEGAEEDKLSTAASSFTVPIDEYNYDWQVDTNGCLQADLPFATIGEDDNKVEYESLNAAVAAAKDNDVIILWRNNTMTEAVSLDKSITITNVRNVKIIDGRNEGTTGGSLFTIPDGRTLTITGTEQCVITVDGADTSKTMGDRLVSINAGGTLNLKNVNMKNTYVDRWGAAITNSGTLNLQGGCTFENNSGVTGAIYNAGTLTDNGTVYSNNTARTQHGGAVHNVGILKITQCVYKSNTTPKGGAAIYNTGTLEDIGCTYESNTSTGNAGGAIRHDGTTAKATFTGSTFRQNSQPNEDGGAIYSTGSKLEMTSCTFDGNSAKNGGALYINLTNIKSAGNEFKGENLIFANNTALENSTYGAGAVMFTGTGTANLTNKAFTDGVYDYTKAHFTNNINKSTYKTSNTDSTHGGAIVVWSSAILNMTGYKLESNVANAGGGGAIHVKGRLQDCSNVYVKNKGKTAAGGAVRINNSYSHSFKDSEFYGNMSGSDGGAIYLSSSANISATDCIFGRIVGEVNEGNTSSIRGGAIYHNNPEGDGSATYEKCKFVGNSAVSGGAHLAVKKLTLKDCTFENPSQSEGVLEDWQ